MTKATKKQGMSEADWRHFNLAHITYIGNLLMHLPEEERTVEGLAVINRAVVEVAFGKGKKADMMLAHYKIIEAAAFPELPTTTK